MGRLNRRRPMAPGFSRETTPLCGTLGVRDRYRTASDAFPTRRCLSPHPCGSPGGLAHLGVIFYANKKQKNQNNDVAELQGGTLTNLVQRQAKTRNKYLHEVVHLRALALLQRFFQSGFGEGEFAVTC